jgi:hypothetical protein
VGVGVGVWVWVWVWVCVWMWEWMVRQPADGYWQLAQLAQLKRV